MRAVAETRALADAIDSFSSGGLNDRAHTRAALARAIERTMHEMSPRSVAWTLKALRDVPSVAAALSERGWDAVAAGAATAAREARPRRPRAYDAPDGVSVTAYVDAASALADAWTTHRGGVCGADDVDVGGYDRAREGSWRVVARGFKKIATSRYPRDWRDVHRAFCAIANCAPLRRAAEEEGEALYGALRARAATAMRRFDIHQTRETFHSVSRLPRAIRALRTRAGAGDAARCVLYVFHPPLGFKI
jgi:hypothetical protein